MKTFIIIFSLFSLSSAFGQNGGYVKAQKKSDIDLVKAFGKSLETAPSSITLNKNQIRTEAYKHKISRLHEIWSGEIKAKERIAAYLRSGNKEEFDLNIIYNAQKYLSNFLIEAYDTNNTAWVRDIAELYMIPLKYLTASKSITIVNPIIDDSQFDRIVVTADSEFKLWVTPETRSLNSVKKIFKSENTISSSQFLYAVSVIIHYAIKNNLENDHVFSKFINSYYSIAMRHHYLRWIFNKGVPKSKWGFIGFFGPRGWKCNPGVFSHAEHIENLRNRRYGKDFFKKIQVTQLRPYEYCNSYQDRDGWIALGVAHLMAAHQLRPSLLHIDPGTYNDLYNYLQASINLFNSRSGYNAQKRTMVFDLGGFYKFSHYDYSGYEGTEYPGWIGTKKNKTKVEKPINQKKSSWDMSHARRFVNFYWSFEKVINELNLDFSQESNLTLEESRYAYANNLLLKTVKYNNGEVYFTNYICGNNGWYRVNYLDKSGAGDAPATANKPSLGKSALTGGQAYFIKYHPELNEHFVKMYEKHFLTKPATTESHLQIITEDLNSTASMPNF